MQVGTFTVWNGGVYGTLISTPILNPPQSGILDMHKIQPRPMALGNAVEIRPMMYLALSYEHRIVDGREAVTFLVRLTDAIENPRRLLLNPCTPAPTRHASNNHEQPCSHAGHIRTRVHRRRRKRKEHNA